MRLQSITAVAKSTGALAKDVTAQLRRIKPDAVLFLTDNTDKPDELAAALAESCDVTLGAVSTGGLIGGGGEHAASPGSSRVVALALSSLPTEAHAVAFHSAPDGLPDLPPDLWASYLTGAPEETPNLLLLAAPPSDASFPLERWLSRLDTTLP